MKRIFGEPKGRTGDGEWVPAISHSVLGFPQNKGDTVFGAIVRRQGEEECLGFFPRGSDTGERGPRALWSLTGSVEVIC